jgi:hypothetical protein
VRTRQRTRHNARRLITSRHTHTHTHTHTVRRWSTVFSDEARLEVEAWRAVAPLAGRRRLRMYIIHQFTLCEGQVWWGASKRRPRTDLLGVEGVDAVSGLAQAGVLDHLSYALPREFLLRWDTGSHTHSQLVGLEVVRGRVRWCVGTEV